MKRKSKIMIMGLLIFSFITTPLVARANSTSWSTHGGSANSHFTPITIQGNLFTEHTEIVAGNMPQAMEGSTLYSTHLNESGKLYAIDLTNNKIQWEFVTDDSKEVLNLVTAGNMVYITTTNKIYALQNKETGFEIKWTINPSSNEKFGELAVDSGIVFYGFYDDTTKYPLKNNKIIAVDALTGKNKWSYSLGDYDPVPYKLTVGDGKIFFFINNQMTMTTNLYAIDQSTSAVQWIAPIYPHLSPSSGYPVHHNGMVFLDVSPSTDQNYVRAFNAQTGKNLWQYKLQNRFAFSNDIGVISANNDSIAFIDHRGNLISLNINNGQENWKTMYADAINSTQIAVSRTPVLLTNNYIILENNQKIKVYDVKAGTKVQEFPYGNRGFIPMMISGDRLIISDKAGTQSLRFIGHEENPEKEIPKEAEIFDIYSVQSGDTLNKIALKFSTTVAYLSEINQLSNPNMLYVGQQLKVPASPTQPVESPTKAEFETYTVQRGDTLGIIAQKHSTTSAHLTEINQLSNPNMIYIGQVLKVPIASVDPLPSQPTVPTVPKTTEYVVKAGDSLAKIAANHQVTVQEIISLNGIENPNMIYVGQKILIPSKEINQTKIHTVSSGESLWKISQLHGVSMDLIIKTNNIVNANELYVGQQLIIQ